MAEAIEAIESFNLNTLEGKSKAEESLRELKKRWLNDTLPGTDIKIGNAYAGMQDITLEEIIQISKIAKQTDAYTVENAGAFQHILKANEDGNFEFDFKKIDKICELARNNNKKIIIDSAVVFGDKFPFKIANLDKETISKLIGTYIKELTSRYGDIIDRIDVFNSIFERGQISKDNNSEEFWIKKFGDNYPQEIIDIVRSNIDFKENDIKLCWNEFYLTNSKYRDRKADFISMIKRIKGIDVIGIQDRFMSDENIDYIIDSLDEFASISRQSNKEICITEFSGSASGVDLENSNTATINVKIQRIINVVKEYCSKNDVFKRIEGHVCDKFDFNHQELKNFGLEISTTGKTSIVEEQQNTMENKDVEEQNKSKRNTLIHYFSKLINKIKSVGKKKNTKLLPEAYNNIRVEPRTKSNSRNVFLESLKFSSKKFAKNRESQQTENIQIKQNKKEETSLDD